MYRIKQRLVSSFMFAALGEDEMAIVVNAMQEANFDEKATVITEGEPGHDLYIVESGQLDCYKKLTAGVSKMIFHDNSIFLF